MEKDAQETVQVKSHDTGERVLNISGLYPYMKHKSLYVVIYYTLCDTDCIQCLCWSMSTYVETFVKIERTAS